MGSWHTRASAASITGACVFAVVTGAGAVFVGDWWGSSHHSTVVTQFVTAPASPATGSHPAVARSVAPAVAGDHTSGGTAGSQAQADAQTARVARSSPARPARKPAAAGSASQGRNENQGHGQGGNESQGDGQGGNESQGDDQGQGENQGQSQGQSQEQGSAQGQASPDPASSSATPPASESAPAPAATPTAGGDQG